MYDDEEEDSHFGRGPKTKPAPNEQFDQAEPGDSFEMADTPPPPPPPSSPRPPRPRPEPRPESTHKPMHLEDEEDGFFAQHRAKIIAAALIVLFGGAAYFLKPGKGTSPSRPAEQMVSIKLPPLPPPPPPPPPKVPPPPPKEQKMEEQQPVAAEEKHEEAPKPKAEAPPAALGTGLKGDGPGMSGLGAAGNGGGFGGPKGGGGGSKWGWYAGQVQSRVSDALRRNKTTKSANLRVQVRIWADASTGRVLRAKIDGTTGDHSVDTALQNEVLTGLQLEPPPPGMPMPIVMRLTARRP